MEDDVDVDVLSAREIEIEVRLRRVQNGTLETLQKNRELLQVTHSSPRLTAAIIGVEWTSC
jgi:hypothetical protein